MSINPEPIEPVVPEATPTAATPRTKKSFLKVIGAKVTNGAKRVKKTAVRVARTLFRATVVTAIETTRTATWLLAKVGNGLGHLAVAALWLVTAALVVVFVLAALVLITAFYLILLAVKIVQLLVLGLNAPYLAPFHHKEKVLAADWAYYIEGLKPAKFHQVSPRTALLGSNVVSIFERVAKTDQFGQPYDRQGMPIPADLHVESHFVVDPAVAQEMALQEELSRRAAARKALTSPKGKATPRRIRKPRVVMPIVGPATA